MDRREVERRSNNLFSAVNASASTAQSFAAAVSVVERRGKSRRGERLEALINRVARPRFTPGSTLTPYTIC